MLTRRRFPAAVTAIALLAPGPAPADDWHPLPDADLTAALTGATLIYDPDEQRFDATGRTRYRLLADRWGWWEVRGGQLCTLWPPAEVWRCFETRISGDNTRIRLTDPDGIVTIGRFAE